MKLRLGNTQWWKRYSRNSTVHGIKYLVDDDLHPAERLLWLLLVTLAVFGTVYVSLLLSKRFTSSPLATVIESTIYPVSEIPYPAVTICTGNRINWSHVDHVVDQYAVGGGNWLRRERFRDFLVLAESVLRDEFELEEKLPHNSNQSLEELEHINLRQLLHDVSPRCSEILEGPCWWRNKYLNCCSIFTHQLSTYGYCWAFNSITAEDIEYRRNETDWPWRTSNYGDWSGLRITLNSSQSSGIGVIVHHPVQWPQVAKFIAAGTTNTFRITPTFTYSSNSVGRLTTAQRGCLFEREIREETVMSLPGLKYHLENCIGECRQQYMVQYCNCSVDFMYPTGSLPICNATGIRCIGEFAELFMRPPLRIQVAPLNIFTAQLRHDFVGSHKTGDSDAKDTVLCGSCLPQCHHVTYSIATESNMLPEEDRDLITLDIHFRYATMVRYRTYVVYEFLDLIVAFGGIASLFLGSSLLSIVEVVYYALCGIFKGKNVPS